MKRWLAVRLAALSIGVASVALVSLVRIPDARACGCFTPPDPSVPIVQAGERIAFKRSEGKVTAHIQIQYSGPAEEFGWLLPLPSVPTLQVGTDELFAQLIAQTQPRYALVAEYNGDCWFDPNNQDSAAGGDDGGGDAGGDGGGEPGSPVVFREDVGPYDAVVLDASSKEAMLTWLDENGFFVPAGTDEAVEPYIREGAYFLALKLLKGQDAGDIQPVVVDYDSEYAMIPIVLTGVAADPNMPVMVWVLGESRAIPRNYFHTEINDAEIDWLNFGSNYIDVITRAVDEAERHQSFVTEYAGTSSIMDGLLNYPERFGDLPELRSINDPIEYVEYVLNRGYDSFLPSTGRVLGGPLLSALQEQLPVPAGLLAELNQQGQGPAAYYFDMRNWLDYDRKQRPELYEGLDLEFDPIDLTALLNERVVQPTLAADALFRDNSYMTRLFTTMSPNEMTRDPVFSFKSDLPDVSNVHQGTLTYYCGRINEDSPTDTPAVITTENGWELVLPDGPGANPWTNQQWPKSQFIQVVREEGEADSVVDNTDEIAAYIEARGLELPGGDGERPHRDRDGGCSVGGDGASSAGSLALGALAALFLLRRRRRLG